MRGKVVVEGEYIPNDKSDLGDCFVIKVSDLDGIYYFNKDRFEVELDTNWAAGTLLLADDGKVWVVMVAKKPFYDYDGDSGENDEDDKIYRVVPCNQLDLDPAVVNSMTRSDFARENPNHKILYQVTSTRTES